MLINASELKYNGRPVYFLSVDWFRFLTLSLTVDRRFDCPFAGGAPVWVYIIIKSVL